MSTSPKPALIANPSSLQTSSESGDTNSVHPFPYDVIVPTTVRRLANMQAAVEGLGIAGVSVTNSEDEAASRAAQAHAQGIQEGQTVARKSFDEQLARERAGVAAALAEFTRDRAAYFEKVEAEVVQLALSIARKILYREAQMDPLLLAGIVRVALEKIDGATGVRLRVHPQNASDWRRYFRTHLDPSDLPEIVEDPSQPPDCCMLETSMGAAAIGLEVQLKEIEQGLMDLLAARPGSGHPGV
jgi:flagellar assembly protein FliH